MNENMQEWYAKFEGVVRKDDESHDGLYLDDETEISPCFDALFREFIGRRVRIAVTLLNECERCGRPTVNGRTSMGLICDACHYALHRGKS
jgi:hypothetical protein